MTTNLIGLIIIFLLGGGVVSLTALILYGAWQSDRLIHQLKTEHIVFPLMEHASLTAYLWLGWRMLHFHLRAFFMPKQRREEITIMGDSEERELWDFLTHGRRPTEQRQWGKLPIAVIMAGVSGLAQVYGFSVLTASSSAAASYQTSIMLLVLGFVLMIGSPIGFGLYLKPGWRGILVGILGLVGEIIGGILGLVILTPYTFFLNVEEETRIQAIQLALISSFGIAFLLFSSRAIKTRREITGLGAGMLLGATGAIVTSQVWPLMMGYLTFAWIWISALLVPGLFSDTILMREGRVPPAPKLN